MYVSNHLSLVEQHRQHADSISERTAQFLAAGGAVAQVPSLSGNPVPPKRATKMTPTPSSSAASQPYHGLSVMRCANSRRRYEKAQAA